MPAVPAQVSAYHLPLDPRWLTQNAASKPHHDHPAIDLMIPIGTPVYAARGGVAWYTHDPACGNGLRVTANDGFEYVYCHASRLSVSNGQHVATGDMLMLSGESGTRVPHLHFGIRTQQRELCPQELLVAWSVGTMLAPSDATPSTGCTTHPPHAHQYHHYFESRRGHHKPV